MRAAIAVFIVCAACGEGRSGSGSNHAVPQELVAAWDASMQVNQSYPLQPRPSAATVICGTISLVENHAAAARTEGVDAASYLGVYDLPLSRIGLEWSGTPSFPEATVSIASNRAHGPTGSTSDSVRIVLNPGSEERIVLSGRYEANGIRGAWVAQSARGTANGSFSMRPHTNSRSESRNCWR